MEFIKGATAITDMDWDTVQIKLECKVFTYNPEVDKVLAESYLI